VHAAWARHLPPGVDAAAVDVVAEGSLPAVWTATWGSAPSRPVVGDASGWITAAELETRSRVVAGRFAGAGLTPGDRILMSTGACIELVVAHVAALRAGFVVVPMNGAYRAREIAHIVTMTRPALAVIDDAERAAGVTTAGPSTIVVGPDVELPDEDAGPLDRVARDDVALLGATSGTTGAPKAAMLTHGNLLATAAALRLAWRWTPDDRLVLALPLFHAHGLCVGLHGALAAGASVVILPRFDPDAVLDAARDEHGTMFFGVPTMYTHFASSPRVAELGQFRMLASGSAPLAAELHRALAVAAHSEVIERYGLTETLMNTSNPYDGERRPGSVGLPLPGVEVALAPGSDGILVRGPNVTPGYWEQPTASAEALADGWFDTGDIGAWDDDGYLRIVGRAKELIITGGFNVYPREVEDVLLQHDSVAEVAVIGTPSDEWGETVTAVVVADGPHQEDALRTFAAERLAPFKCPRIIRYVDALPRNALGKVVRSEL
jgi:malonyl-CoA/methylmalonyl-CoA synthetase